MENTLDRRCELRASQGIDVPCEKENCIFWRVTNHLDLGAPEPDCAVEHFGLLDGKDPELFEWLLSVKDRLAEVSPADGTDGSD